jgi:hypothetical protein
MHTLYLGPSWAVQSFETLHGDDPIKTSLAQELGLKNFTSLAACGDSNMAQIDAAREFMASHPELAPFRAIFITSNSLQDSDCLVDIPRVDFAKQFITHDDVLHLIRDLELKFYCALEDLNIPVALIGAHTDVIENNWSSNITVIHPSWQNFLAEQCSLNSFFGWPAEIAHLWLSLQVVPRHGPVMSFDCDQLPSKSAVFEINHAMSVWKKLERSRLWCGAHPNIRGNQLFAQAIGDLVNQWLEKTKNIVYT